MRLALAISGLRQKKRSPHDSGSTPAGAPAAAAAFLAFRRLERLQVLQQAVAAHAQGLEAGAVQRLAALLDAADALLQKLVLLAQAGDALLGAARLVQGLAVTLGAVLGRVS
ncbi:hypothetical protein [Pseudomonas sp. Pc102]|uniref:hypothetical protein n=1 Tax=Pseudomonas sp. Pc102 TaxID=2678261 RepID=UPI001BCAFF02|nr:hypothetical protein [Pseudomonas sp. Pc102]